MYQEEQSQVSFGDATGRMTVCCSCRKPLPRPETSQQVIVCAHCRTETVLSPPLASREIQSMKDDLKLDESVSIATNAGTPTSSHSETRIEPDRFDEEFELKLEPESERISPSTSLAGWQVNLPLSGATLVDVDRVPSTNTYSTSEFDSAMRSEQAKLSYNDSAGLYPRERHYPTLEAMQRLYKLFGYVAVLLVFPYVGFRFLYLLVTTKEQHLQVLAEFSEFAVPVLFGCVALTATLFAASEGIRLAMDIQDNTLRTANSSGRRKLN